MPAHRYTVWIGVTGVVCMLLLDIHLMNLFFLKFGDVTAVCRPKRQAYQQTNDTTKQCEHKLEEAERVLAGSVADLEQVDKLKSTKMTSLNRCHSKFKKNGDEIIHMLNKATMKLTNANTKEIPFIYAITPTHARQIQKAVLTQLRNTFLGIANLHWIVIEDSTRKSETVGRLLSRSGVNHTHLLASTSHKNKVITYLLFT